MIIRTLSNNITVRIIPSEKFKTDFLSINFIRPLQDSDNTKNALLPFLLKAGCSQYDNLKGLNIALQEQYGANLSVAVRKKGNYQMIGYQMTFLKDCYALKGEKISNDCFDILKNVLQFPKIRNLEFNKEILEVEKNNLKEKISGALNDKISYGIDKCSAYMCRGSAFSLSEMGELEDFASSKINEKLMYKTYKNMITDAQVEIVYVGGMDENALCNSLEERFSFLQPVVVKMEAKPLDTSRSEGGDVLETMAINQCKLNMGFTTEVVVDDKDYVAMLMATVVFGGGPSSKLFMNVREKLSLCYYAAARYNKLNGQVMVYSGVENDKLEIAKKEILKQLEAIKQGDVTEEELEAAKKSVINSFHCANDSAFAMEDFIMGELPRKHGCSMEDYIEKIKRITKEQAIAAAQKITLHTTYVLKGEAE